ncbi:MAG: SDR family NAD(P)-dependent oxidoreductase [Ottowia sp.]|nr:SDR family NAD(P)-dependent oxidoreductase [Ottowia sp.]
MQLEKNTFLITGAASGLGQATARQFHQAGANVLIADIDEQAGQNLAADMGKRALFCKTDVSAESDAHTAVALAQSHFGGLHGLINCAGVAPSEKVLGKNGPHQLDRFYRTIHINLIGSFNMLRLAAQVMAQNTASPSGERGIIVNTASIAAYEGQIGQAAYAASKAGVIGMTLPIARELARQGIRVMTIAPGLFMTPMLAGMSPEVQEALNKVTLFPPRLGQASEYAQLAQHIVENTMLNGSVIRLDGAVRLAPK